MLNSFQLNEFDEDSAHDSDDDFEIEQMNGMSIIEHTMSRMSLQFDTTYKEEQQNKRRIGIKKVLENIHSVRYLTNHKCYQKSYVLYIYLTGIKPRIWREVIVPSNLSLAVFQDKILTALFNWQRNYHSYHFLVPHRKNKFISFGPLKSTAVDIMHVNYINGSHKVGSFIIESSFIYLSDVLYLKGSKLRYVHDLGDQFHHTIILKDIIFTQKKRNIYKNKISIQILDGQRNGPPEDTNGNRQYAETLNGIISNNDYKQYNELCHQWNTFFGGCFDPELFDKIHCKQRMKKYLKTMLSGYYRLHDLHGPRTTRPPVQRDCFNRNCPNKKSFDDIEYQTKTKTCNPDKMKACKACKSAFYCNRYCQKKHWNKEHRYYCFNYRNAKISVV